MFLPQKSVPLKNGFYFLAKLRREMNDVKKLEILF